MSIPVRSADHGSTLAPAVLAAVAWIALGLQLLLSLHLTQVNGKPAVDGLIAYLGYFTVLSNLFVALVATDGARREGTPAGLYRASMAGCATTSILVVGLGYHALLRNIWDPHGATAAHAYRQLPAGRGAEPWVLVGTAHPAKFNEIVEPLVGHEVPVPPALARLLSLPRQEEELEPTLEALRGRLS